jgi:hypothetical protein
MQTKDSRDRRRDAWKRLIAAIGKGQPDPAVYVVFAENSARFSTEVFELACRRLEHTCQWFPSYAEFEDELKLVSKHLTEQREATQRASRQIQGKPVSPDQLARLRQDVQARIRKATMR